MGEIQTLSDFDASTDAVRSVDALQAIIDVVATPVFVKDRQHRWVLVNQAMCDFMGHRPRELIGKSDFDFLPREQAEVFWQKDDLVFATGADNENEEGFSDATGEIRTIVTRKRLVHVGGTPLLVGVITDITAFREAEAHSRYLAYHDALSGLPNRALLNERLDKAIADAGPSATRCNLLIVDLDRFKQVNDAYGHAAGDELIREFAKRVTALVSAADTVARLGGDEFAILLYDQKSREDLDKLCHGILDAASAPFVVAGVTVHVGASIGVAFEPASDTSRGEMLRKADVALYSAKSAGRNCCRMYNEAMDEGRAARVALERDLREAITTGKGLEVYYQPLYSGTSITGVEALVRWNHPRLGFLLPARFVPIAEETGLISQLGDMVLEKACAALSRWPGVTLAINISAVQLRDPGLPLRIMRRLAEFSLAPSRLDLEITETAVLSTDGITQTNLETLRSAGFRIALDDFGTGYSSLSHLQNLRVDSVKIDQSFVSNLGQTSDSAPIVQAVIHIARMLGLKVTAEGVETDSQRQFLLDTGCSNLQGFLLSPPLPEAEIGPLLASRRPGPTDAQSAA